MKVRPLWVAGGTLAYGAGAYLVYSVVAKADPATDAERRQVVPRAESVNIFDSLARSYDRHASSEETVLRMGALRRRLVAQAGGDVLEVAAGTGRNLEFYDGSRTQSVLLLDHSPNMLDKARRKAETLPPPEPPARAVDSIAFEVGDAQGMPAYADASFDAVVDTFGLCSFEDPVAALREMGRVCRPGGRVLLLEHGRTTHGWLSWILDRKAVLHARHWGCYFNRDIVSLVREAGLRVEKATTHHWGTTHMVVARPPPRK